jgi:hypothetical protein
MKKKKIKKGGKRKMADNVAVLEKAVSIFLNKTFGVSGKMYAEHIKLLYDDMLKNPDKYAEKKPEVKSEVKK